MMKRLIQSVITFLLLAPLVFGNAIQDFTITAASKRENGDDLSLAEIARHRISCGTVSGGPYDAVTFEPDFAGQSPQTVTTGEVFSEGNWFCVAQTVDTDGRVSIFSGELNFTVGRCETTDCRPLPPVITVSFGNP